MRPWATVLKAPTTRGIVWLKAAGAGTASEIRLYELLARVAPARVLLPLAIDLERDWLVLPDGGPVLGQLFSGDRLVDALADVIPQYAQLQLALMPHAEEMVTLGVTDMRAPIMPARFEQALTAVRGFLERDGSPDDWHQYRALQALREPFHDWCRQLAAAPVGASLDHNDLHQWNIFVTTSETGLEARFYDFGDSVVSHPFASWLVVESALSHFLEAAPDDPRILRVRDAYLEAFGEFAPHGELVSALEQASKVARVARVLTWHRAVSGQPNVKSDYTRVPFEKFAELLSV